MHPSWRAEKDSMGEIMVPANRLWGAQTQRSLENFNISHERMPVEVVSALLLLKKAAALVNGRAGRLPRDISTAVVAAADEAMTGRHNVEFPLGVWQTGSGTQTHMNVNEVLANRASEILGGGRGSRRLVHPNDHVNLGQSSNDVFPSALNIAAVLMLEDTVIPALEALEGALAAKARHFMRHFKIGRTHLMDATPMTLGQEFSGYAAQLELALGNLRLVLPGLHELALGGTAVGTGLNAPEGFAAACLEELQRLTGRKFRESPNKFRSLASQDELVFAHGALKSTAAALFKIANDLRLLGSGPRAGLSEIILPSNEPGSSIMPGKVNPTQCEAMAMACAQVFGNDVTINIAGASGALELNAYRPLLAHAFMQSSRLLSDASRCFRIHCVDGIRPNEARLRENLDKSLMLVTALAPRLGYDKAALIAKTAHDTGTSLREAALALGLANAEDLDEWLRPEEMVPSLEAREEPKTQVKAHVHQDRAPQ